MDGGKIRYRILRISIKQEGAESRSGLVLVTSRCTSLHHIQHGIWGLDGGSGVHNSVHYKEVNPTLGLSNLK